MNYAAFKLYLASFLWKQNDVDLVNNLDNLIKMANHELNTTLNIQRRQVTLNILPETQDYELPANFRSMVSLSNLDVQYGSGMANTTLLEIYRKRTQSPLTFFNLYAVDEGEDGAKILRLAGPFSAEEPGNFALVYRANVPDFAVTDASWLEANYLDLYTYTVLSHTAPFLREDERVPLWQQMKVDAKAAAYEEDQHHVEFGGSPLNMRPHHKVP